MKFISSNVWGPRALIACALTLPLLTACKTSSDRSGLADDGSMPFPQVTADALKGGCDAEVPEGLQVTNFTKEECYLFMAGVTNKESSWNLQKPAEAWGQPDNPARGLTQSRDSDASFVGLPDCVGQLERDPICNVRVGLRNIVTRADTLDAGVSVHLGAINASAKGDYIKTLERVWNRPDVREAFGIKGPVREFSVALTAPLRSGPVQRAAPAPQNNNQPKSGGPSVGGHSCEQQKAWGKCKETWMHPVCSDVCKR